VLIAERAIERVGHLERRDVLRCVDVAGLVALDLGVARRLEQRGHEGVLGLEAHQHEHVGALSCTAKLGFIGTAWMFSTPVAMLCHLDEVAADLPRHVGQIGDRGDDLILLSPRRRGRRRGRGTRERHRARALQFFMALLRYRSRKPWAWLPRIQVHCRKIWFS
jgi:hypothetical protein